MQHRKKTCRTAAEYLQFQPVPSGYRKRRRSTLSAKQGRDIEEQLAKVPRVRGKMNKNVECFEDRTGEMEFNSEGDEYMESDSSFETFSPQQGHDNSSDEEDLVVQGFNTSIKEDFNSFVIGGNNRKRFSSEEVTAIELLYRLRKKAVSLDMYETIMKWRIAANEREFGRSLGGNSTPISRDKILNKLAIRYNMSGKLNHAKTIVLPSSGAKARIITNDAEWCIQSLLTDPQISDEDYLFCNKDPLSGPPDAEELAIGDINTGKAYKESYQKYIKDPTKQVLLPVIFYIDAAATAQFTDLPITALKFTFGIFNRKARARPHMWRTLGYVPPFSKERSHGKRTYHKSGHVQAATSTLSELAPGEGVVSEGSKVVPLQDYHNILATILEDFTEIMEKGFEWDLLYNGKRYDGIQFVPYVHFIKCDTEEADKLAGKYGSRSDKVAHLCRYCMCPTQDSDNPRAEYELKTTQMIRDLVQNGDETALQAMSQHKLNNTWHPLRFGAHTEQGIHGSCPMEMLHALLLGIFKYVRDVFFEKIGDKSKLATEINALAITYGELLDRQSDRDMPKSKFSQGIQKGKLMAKEYPGVLLLIAAILRSSKGVELLSIRKEFGPDGIADWTELVETLLMWERWLSSDEMERFHVERAKQKHRYIMALMGRVANRQAGMGLKITKFHTIVHYADDIINFGVPMNFDTGSDEAGHKPTKIAAKTTQKRKELFDEQVGKRTGEMQALELAHQEIYNKKKLWDYHEEYIPRAAPPPPIQGGTKLISETYLVQDDGEGGKEFLIVSKKNKDSEDIIIAKDFVDFVTELGKKVDEYLSCIVIHSTIKHKGMTIRGTHSYSKKEWRDWVMVDWASSNRSTSTSESRPCKVWGFVDLRALPARNNAISHGGLSPITPGIYAIVEMAENVIVRGRAKSEIFQSVLLRVGRLVNRKVTQLLFHLVEVDSIDGTAVVVPDVGGPANRYMLLDSREEWNENFKLWLASEHESFAE